jgi:hypothetical protein
MSKMLTGVRKFSHKIRVREIGLVGGSAGVVVVLTAVNLDPAARIIQTPTTKTTMRRRYGK